MIFFLIGCYIVSGNFDYEYSVNFYHSDPFGIQNCNNVFLFLIVYFSNFIFHGIFWVNIAIYNSRHNKYTIVSIIFSYVEYILLFIILDELALIFFHDSPLLDYLNLTTVWNWYSPNDPSLIGVLISTFIPALLSSIFVLVSYKNKEKVLSDL